MEYNGTSKPSMGGLVNFQAIKKAVSIEEATYPARARAEGRRQPNAGRLPGL
jgi:hypothetical protein